MAAIGVGEINCFIDSRNSFNAIDRSRYSVCNPLRWSLASGRWRRAVISLDRDASNNEGCSDFFQRSRVRSASISKFSIALQTRGASFGINRAADRLR